MAVSGYFEIRDAMRIAASNLNTPVSDLCDRVDSMLAESESLSQQVEQMADAPTIDADTLIGMGEKIGDVLVIAQELPGSNNNVMRGLIDSVRKKTGPVALLLVTAMSEDKVALVAGVSKDLVANGVSAGDWVKQVAPVVGGGGGGKPDLAQAGGKQPENIKKAIASAD